MSYIANAQVGQAALWQIWRKLLQMDGLRKWSIVNEILNENLMKIGADNPTTTETRRIQCYTSQLHKSDKRPCGRFGANFCKRTASEKWSIVTEILNGNELKIAADNPMADLVQITTTWLVANRGRQSTSRFNKFLQMEGLRKWSIVNEILNGYFIKIASDSPMAD